MYRSLTLLAVLLLCLGSLSLAAPDADQELKAVQGTWERAVKAEGSTFKIVKVHSGKTTKLTVYNSAGKIVHSKTSEFRLDVTGRVRIFTFFNDKITAGEGAGQTSNGESSYVYRVVGDVFYEHHGLLIGDREEPYSFSWKRVKE